MLLQVRAEVKHRLPKPQTASVQVMLNRRRKLPLQQRLRLAFAQSRLHHQVTHLGKGDEECHGSMYPAMIKAIFCACS
jgi:hypothetical protein